MNRNSCCWYWGDCHSNSIENMSRMLYICYVELLKRISSICLLLCKCPLYNCVFYIFTTLHYVCLCNIMCAWVVKTYCLYWDEVMVNMCIVCYHFHEVISVRLLSRCASVVSLVIHMKSIIECPYLLSRTAMQATSSCYEASSHELYR